jgi:hypothetical protein
VTHLPGVRTNERDTTGVPNSCKQQEATRDSVREKRRCVLSSTADNAVVTRLSRCLKHLGQISGPTQVNQQSDWLRTRRPIFDSRHERDISLRDRCVQTGSGSYTASHLMNSTGTFQHLVMKLRMCGALSSLPLCVLLVWSMSTGTLILPNLEAHFLHLVNTSVAKATLRDSTCISSHRD